MKTTNLMPWCLYYTLCEVNLWIAVTGFCPDPNGNQVTWWVVYQQKSLPFIHFYSDSENNQDIQLHFPEKKEGVLAKAINKIIQKELDTYIIYSNDLLNVAKIAEALRVPSFLKWNHGIIAMDSSLSKGFWILHNNLFFPALNGSHFAEPGGKVWKDATIGDSTDNVFYVCISAGNEQEVRGMLTSILVGNAFFHHSSPSTLFKNEIYKKALNEHTSFHSSGSALPFMNSLYNHEYKIQPSNLFQFSSNVNPSGRVYVYTKPRGPLMGGKSYCNSRGRNSQQNFIGLAETNVKKANDFTAMETIFAISDNPASEEYGTTCFGQDVAAYTEIVTVMVCLTLPSLHKDLLRSSVVTTWFCSNEE
ncbi:uncharacterized protein LOC111131181 isoform X2 [Crassostrea virginica]